jgi:hypothetical protein
MLRCIPIWLVPRGMPQALQLLCPALVPFDLILDGTSICQDQPGLQGLSLSNVSKVQMAYMGLLESLPDSNVLLVSSPQAGAAASLSSWQPQHKVPIVYAADVAAAAAATLCTHTGDTT